MSKEYGKEFGTVQAVNIATKMSIPKRMLIHDVGKFFADGLFENLPEDIFLISTTTPVEHCRGCFSCWIKTPGRCIIEDDVQKLPALIGKCDELIIVSRMVYGGFSPEVKAYIDRLIPSLLPFFKVKNEKMTHPSRNNNKFKLSLYFYTDDNGEIFTLDGQDDLRLQEFALRSRRRVEKEDAYMKNNEWTILRSKPIKSPESIDEETIVAKLAEAVANNIGAATYECNFVGDVNAIKEVKF